MEQRRQSHPGTGDAGFSMIATMLSLVATALLVALLLGTTLHSGNKANTSISNAPGVAEANGLQAQQALSTALSAATTAAAGSGGYGTLTPSALSASESSITFVAGPTWAASVVSVATEPDTPGGLIGGPSGSITLARASDGTCWLIWKSARPRGTGHRPGLRPVRHRPWPPPPAPARFPRRRSVGRRGRSPPPECLTAAPAPGGWLVGTPAVYFPK